MAKVSDEILHQFPGLILTDFYQSELQSTMLRSPMCLWKSDPS